MIIIVIVKPISIVPWCPRMQKCWNNMLTDWWGTVNVDVIAGESAHQRLCCFLSNCPHGAHWLPCRSWHTQVESSARISCKNFSVPSLLLNYTGLTKTCDISQRHTLENHKIVWHCDAVRAVMLWELCVLWELWCCESSDAVRVVCAVQPTSAERSWLVNPLDIRWYWIFAAFLPALLATILIFMDQQITAVIVNRKENKLVVSVSTLL